MGDEISGRGDPLRVLELAWRGIPAPKRGPKPKFSLADILAVAVEIADKGGLEAVSTRGVAERIGISPTSFYTYVPGKDELLDLMLEAIHVELHQSEGQGWRAKLENHARISRAFYIRHPWVLQLGTHRPILGPNFMAAKEATLAAVDGLGLDELEMDRVVTLVNDYVIGAVRGAALEQNVWKRTGRSDDDWWYTVAAFLSKVISPKTFPVVSRVGPATGASYGLHGPEPAFEFGLGCVLDGIEKYIASKEA